ncbi:hypothetical protein [Gryllotalpicola koreensis]|uniref:Phage tail protein n=1 Tax=Gryllotalpicola koreensis TaxID=993086 RepID=A0ABP8A6N4_9MICO
MANTVAPLQMKAQKNLIVRIPVDPAAPAGDTKDYQKHVSSMSITDNDPTTISWKGGTDDARVTDNVPPDVPAQCVMNVAQDTDNPDSLWRFMRAHKGEQVTVIYKPNAAGTFGTKATIILKAPALGGPTNQYNEATVTMDCLEYEDFDDADGDGNPDDEPEA